MSATNVSSSDALSDTESLVFLDFQGEILISLHYGFEKCPRLFELISEFWRCELHSFFLSKK
jgi:hypothetical protein